MMRPTLALFFVGLLPLSLITAQDTTTDDFNNKLDNIEVKPSARLDPYIRKALLRALSELEESGDVITSSDANDGFSFNTGIQENEDFTETQTAKEGIQIHSFVVNGQSAFENSTSLNPTVLDNNISILSTTAGNVENQATFTRSTISPINDYYQTKNSGINLQQVRSIPTSTLQNIKNDEKTTSFKQRLSTTTTSTTTTTTTTTTPKPTHNEDGENIEDVDKRDVQVYQAPLVAAFTVHQDANGQPKKVIPLYQQTNSGQQLLRPSPTNNVPNVFTPQPLRQTIPLPTLLPNGNINPVPQNDFITHQLILQKELEEKQRLLEEQLRLLQLQQSQQEELLRKQQYLLQNKQIPNNVFDQSRPRNVLSNSPVNNFSVQKNFQQSQPTNQNNLRQQGSFVSIQPSVPFEQTTTVPNQQQQLPNREAVDFLLQLRNHQFPLQENHLPQGIGSFLQPSPTQSFHQGLNLNQISTNQLVPKQNTRVFRQEVGVGNLGINNQNFNRFNTFNPVYTNTHTNRYFPQQQPRPNQYTPDFELKQLLYQNGLNGRHTEDLNIVSKVLSLNHGIPLNNVSNRLPFDSRRQVNTFI